MNREFHIKKITCFLLIFFVLLIQACQKKRKTLFEAIPSSQSGVSFSNQITESDSINIVDFDYIYNGSGVGIADLNGDGLPEIIFGGNQVSSKLYLNKGDFHFEDITLESGLETDYWVEGITFTDINDDGLVDIYFSVSNRENTQNPNRLFVNQGPDPNGIPTFKEESSKYGLDLIGYYTQAAFFDYDLDGDLDCYLLANAQESFQRNLSRPRIKDGSGKSNDKLLRNEGNGVFVDVTKDAGIFYEGYGLGLVISDLNQDGSPDIYVANDFLSNDLMYINQGDGTFRNEISERLDHQSFNSMGADAGDINGDGLSELVVVDMFPPDNFRQKTMFSPTENHTLYQNNLDKGYEPQYVRNVLQLNRGDGTFSEIGQLAGIAQTDWSWSPLLADFDLDGLSDLIISNGYGRDITDLDYLTYTNNLGPFMTPEEKKKLQLDGLNLLQEVRLENFAYRNNGDLTFSDVSQSWGLIDKGISNGMAYGDLDLDGDLDLVMNNLNQEAGIYKNTIIQAATLSDQHWLKVKLIGPKKNLFSIGATVRVYYSKEGKSQVLQKENYPSRGYKSASMDILNFGLNSSSQIDSLEVIWPTGQVSKLAATTSNQTIVVNYHENLPLFEKQVETSSPQFEEVSKSLGINYQPSPQVFDDFNHQSLLHQKHSDLGPGIAVGDLNGDGMEDFYLAGSNNNPGQLFFQQDNGTFKRENLPSSGNQDEMGLLFFDVDLDGDLDLYIAHGSSQRTNPENLQDSFYLNNGKGELSLDNSRIPAITSAGSMVRAADFDGDGDLDLFVGGRTVPGRYPEIPESYLLQNNNGYFEDITPKEFSDIGMTTDAIWTDYDQDGNIDLMVVGEWMPVTFFLSSINEDGEVEFKKQTLSKENWDSRGWWNSIYPLPKTENTGQGYLLANQGLNSRWKANQDNPIELVYKDFDGNGSVDPILFQFLGEKSYPIPSKNQIITQIPSWKKRFLAYREFAKIDQTDFFLPENLESSQTLQAMELRSGILTDSNDFIPFTNSIQATRIFGMVELSDKYFLVGNYFGNETVTGRNDAGRGFVLNKNLEIQPALKTGFQVPGDARAIAVLRMKNDTPLLLISRYNEPLLAFRLTKNTEEVLFDPEPNDRMIQWFYNGTMFKQQEFYYGSGYLSQSSRKITIPNEADSALIFSYTGTKRTLIFEK